MILKFTLTAILSEEYRRSRNHNQIRQATAERCHALDVHYPVKTTSHGTPLRITQRGFLVATVFEPRALRLSHLNYSALMQRWNRR